MLKIISHGSFTKGKAKIKTVELVLTSSAPPTHIQLFTPGQYFDVMYRVVLGTIFFCHLAYHMTLFYKSNQV